MSNKGLRVILGILIASVMLAAVFSGGFVAGHYFTVGIDNQPGLLGLPTNEPTETVTTPSSDTNESLFKPFWEAWDIIHQEYVDQPVDDLALMRGAIRGMLDSLGDEHSGYMDPQEFSDANTNLNGTYEGIGAFVDTAGEYLKVISPIKGSPAEAAGLLPGDEIRMIDGEDMTGVNPELARLKVLGPAGSVVRLSILRSGLEELLEIEITRGKITIPSVTGEIIENDIAYVTLSNFGDATADDLRKTMSELMAQDPRGLILDLRYNGGGYLQTAIDVASEFIAEGVIMYEQYGDGTRQTYEANSGGLATEIPMVVLVNEGSASASEIVAGAIQVRERGLLVGVTTYGKGSVQNWIPLENDQGAIRVTIAKWLLPDETTIHKKGLTPDVVVEISDEDLQSGRDPQLDEAIKLLKAE